MKAKAPAGWEMIPLSNLGRWSGGGTPSKANPAFWVRKGIPWVSPKDMKRDWIDDAEDHISKAAVAASATNVVPNGSILIVTRSGILSRTLPVAKTLLPVAINQDLKALIPEKHFDPDFLLYALQGSEDRILHECRKSGTTVANLDTDRLLAFAIPVPPLEEQHRIVAVLGDLFKHSRSAREELGRLPRLVARYKQAVLAAAFRGELTKQWRKTRGVSRSAAELRKLLVDERDLRRRNEGIRTKGANRNTPPTSTDLPILPDGWAWVTFEECLWDLTVGHVGPMKSRYVSKGVPFLRSFNVRPNRIDSEELAYINETFDRELRKSKLSAGTIVVVRTGAPGVAAVIPQTLDGANCSDLVICRPVRALDSHYAAHFINSDFAQNLVRRNQVGVAQQHFNVGAMSSLAVPVAPLDEQMEIIRKINHAFDKIEKLSRESTRAMSLLDRLDQATLRKAFRGELLGIKQLVETKSSEVRRSK